MDFAKCSACGVIKSDGVFITRAVELGIAQPMSSEAFYSKCCVYAKKPGCINQIESSATPDAFDKHCQSLGADTHSFMAMAKELRAKLIKDN